MSAIDEFIGDISNHLAELDLPGYGPWRVTTVRGYDAAHHDGDATSYIELVIPNDDGIGHRLERIHLAAERLVPAGRPVFDIGEEFDRGHDIDQDERLGVVP